ncbi:MAG: apolipoprotein N-acyltransferase [Acidobacteria bacterium]|nr:apolipoprotein N-acyltransferase [Acidobacteriota bacterium]
MTHLNPQSPGLQLRPYLLSALLFALSYPSFPWVRLEILAWIWMVPMLLALRSVESFWRFTLLAGITMMSGWACAMSWLAWGSTAGAMAIVFLVSVVTTVPFAAFFVIQKVLGRRWALLTLPVVWTAWEWCYQNIDGMVAWPGIAVTQHKLTWLIQYIDITGMWGIVFWLVLLNILIVMAVETRGQGTGDRGQDWKTRGQGTGDRGQGRNKSESNSISSLSILHSSFSILNSSFIQRLVLIAVVMFGLPLLYAAFIFSQVDQSAGGQSIRVMAVQPNIDPWQKSSPEIRQKVVGSIVNQTNEALNIRPEKPDLIVWPEVAIPVPLLQDELAREFVFRNVTRWNIPVVTGTIDARKNTEPAAVSSTGLENSKKKPELYNAAVFLAPLQTESGTRLIRPSEPYHKRKLMPFAEEVPYSKHFPGLSSLAVELNWNQTFTRGNGLTLFSVQQGPGQVVKVAAPICYEHFYPSLIAEFVRNGAQVITLLSNDAWFSKSHGEYQIAAFTTLRAIETRRSIVRCTNTGLTCFIDPFGRVYRDIPWWQEDSVTGDVALSSRMSLYVRFPDAFPKICFCGVVVLGIVAGLNRVRFPKN